MNENGRNRKLKPLQIRAITEILSGKNYQAVCDELDIAKTTLWQWRNDPAFQHELEKQEAIIQVETITRLKALCSIALDVIETLIRDKTTPPATRLRACQVILERVQILQAPDDQPDDLDDDDDWDIYEGASPEAVRALLDAMNQCRRESDDARIEGNGEVRNDNEI